MPVQHIENLKISNFKCFKQLDVEGIAKVNLIGGKNNVGKTAFLEAVELFAPVENVNDLIYSIYSILKRRQHHNFQKEAKAPVHIDFIYDNETKIVLSSGYKTCSIEHGISHFIDSSSIYDEGDNIFPVESISISVNNDKKIIPIEKLINTSPIFIKIKYTNIYIVSSKSSEQDIAISLGSLINFGRELFLSNSLSLFDNNILDLKQTVTESGVTLKLKLKNKEQLVLLSSLGEGVNRYIAILCAIWANKDGVLLIDEIENGIHYTNYKKLWQIIFQASFDANCQLFITSHSKECISAFNEVQFENDQCTAQYYEFYRNLKTDLITASPRNKEQLRYALTHEGRIRGE